MSSAKIISVAMIILATNLLSGCGSPKATLPSGGAVNRSQTLTGENSATALSLTFLAGAIHSTERVNYVAARDATPVTLCPVPRLGVTFPGDEVAGSSLNLPFASCKDSTRSDGVWTGGELWLFDTTVTMNAFQAWSLTAPIVGGSVLRTFQGSLGAKIGTVVPQVPTKVSNSTNTVYLSTVKSDVICYPGASGCPADQGIKTVFSNSGAQQIRFVTVAGVRFISAAVGGLTAQVDETLTTSPVTVLGLGVGKSVIAGELRVFNNLAQQMTTTKITQPLVWTNWGCLPSSGQLSSTCANNNVETLTLTGPNQAQITACDGTTSQIPLTRCL